MWYAGIAWADQHHDVVVLEEAGQQMGARRVAHSKEGISELTHFLLSIPQTPEQMACVLQTNQGLLITALLEAGVPMYPVNPKTVDRRRNAAGAKTDAIDAYVLAKTGQSDVADLPRLQPDHPLVQELQRLTRDQDALIASQTRLLNQLTACLKAYYPVALGLFAKLQQRSPLLFLQRFPTPPALRAAWLEAISRVLPQAQHPQAAKAARAIWETVRQPHLEADAVTTRAKSRLMLALLSQVLPLVEQIAAYHKEMRRLFLTPQIAAFWAGCRVRANDWPLASWPNGVMIGRAIRAARACKRWLGPPRWPLPVGTTPKPTNARRA
jgi:transposase